jgi:hypothetical protein
VSHRLSAVPLREKYVDARELADLMGVSVSTIKRWVAAGMPSETWGMRRTRRFLPSQAIRWARSRKMLFDSPNRSEMLADTIPPTTRDGDRNAPGQAKE